MKKREKQLRELFNKFDDKKVLIIGDVMIDIYLFGKVTRISPEAPVPVVDVFRRNNRLGGAANVALNVRALNAKPILCSVIGNDDAGFEISQLLFQEKMATEGLILGCNRKTTKKYRIIGNSTQMLRIDEEDNHPLTEQEETQFWRAIQDILKNEHIDVIIFQDYDKGSITPNIIKWTTEWARANNVPTVVDPKKRNFLEYKDVTLFKPNLKELYEGMEIPQNAYKEESKETIIEKLSKKNRPELIMVTLSEQGILIYNKTKFEYFPACIRNIADVSGAGDTVVSVAALTLACGESSRSIAELSNLAGGLVCEYIGVVPINKEQFLNEAIINGSNTN
ncbi:MAG: PfkB family carbohydrate kinase [Bacteroidales bacterium]|jgi:rfaE bifunctional protein kinase chain/domain|nr:PfkB family carbohydrate kinase [Bacteroidales bacterium]